MFQVLIGLFFCLIEFIVLMTTVSLEMMMLLLIGLVILLMWSSSEMMVTVDVVVVVTTMIVSVVVLLLVVVVPIFVFDFCRNLKMINYHCYCCLSYCCCYPSIVDWHAPSNQTKDLKMMMMYLKHLVFFSRK